MGIYCCEEQTTEKANELVTGKENNLEGSVRTKKLKQKQMNDDEKYNNTNNKNNEKLNKDINNCSNKEEVNEENNNQKQNLEQNNKQGDGNKEEPYEKDKIKENRKLETGGIKGGILEKGDIDEEGNENGIGEGEFIEVSSKNEDNKGKYFEEEIGHIQEEDNQNINYEENGMKEENNDDYYRKSESNSLSQEAKEEPNKNLNGIVEEQPNE